MYRIIKVLNNNGILVYDDHTGREMILLGNGVGFGKRPAQQIASLLGETTAETKVTLTKLKDMIVFNEE